MENKKQRTEKYPKFLENKPCGQDLFDGKSHDTIAQHIANILVNNNAKIIGIDGDWGSGKSNMVNLIKDKLDHNIFHFFIYDAWGHQTDFQRRSILENLTSFLVDEAKILKKDKWNAKLLQLLSRKRSVGTKIVKELSAVAKVSAIIAFTMPLLVFIGGMINDNLFKLVYWGIVLVFSLALLFYLQIKNMKKYGQSTKFSSIIHELSLSYMDYTNEKSKDSIEQSIKYETIYDEEPSTRDFKNWMKEINEDIKENTLIIVFDNMDRLPKDKVQELWAAIHTFFAEEKYSKIRVIVPFDRTHIKSAFKSEDILLKSTNMPDGSDNNNDVACYGNDFINKTFDVVFRVSPPVMSDWKAYFADRWEYATGKKVDNKVTQIYDLLSKGVTPREIIAFINEFVTIKQISDDSIPDKYIALFIFGKDKITLDPQKEILQPTYLGALDFMYKNDSDLPKYISALFYQLPPEKALDVIYREKLRRALDNKDSDQIKTIQTNPDVFNSILENAITSITNIPNAVFALSQCMVDGNNEQVQLAWDCVYNLEKDQIINNPLQDYQKELIQHISQKDKYLQKLVEGFYNLQDLEIISYYDSIRQLSEIKDVDPFNHLIEKVVNAESFIEFVEKARETYKQYKIICKQEELDDFFSGLSVTRLSTLTVIPIIKSEYELGKYSSHLNALVDSNLNNKENIRIIYDKFKELELPIAKKLPDTQIQSLFTATKNTDDFYYDLICMRISRLKNFTVSLQPAFNSILNNKDKNVVEEIAARIEYYISYEDILLNVDSMNSPLLKDVAKKLTVNQNGDSIIENILNVLQKYEIIKNAIELDANNMLSRFNQWYKNAQSVINSDNINTLPILFFKDARSTNNELCTYCIKTAIEYLNLQSKEDWEQSILDGNFNYQLLMIVRPNNQACFDAFKKLLVEKANDNNSLPKETVADMIELFESNKRELLTAFNNVRDCFCDKGCDMTLDLFDYYGEWLLKYANLEEKASALRTIFKPSLDTDENIQLILKNQEKMVKIVENAGEENNDFKDKIVYWLERDYKDSSEFKEFAEKIGVKSLILDNGKDVLNDMPKGE